MRILKSCNVLQLCCLFSIICGQFCVENSVTKRRIYYYEPIKLVFRSPERPPQPAKTYRFTPSGRLTATAERHTSYAPESSHKRSKGCLCSLHNSAGRNCKIDLAGLGTVKPYRERPRARIARKASAMSLPKNTNCGRVVR